MTMTTKQKGHVPLNTPTEDMTWNHKHFNKRRLAQAILGRTLRDADMMTPGFLHTRGNAGWMLIGPVFHNGDMYRRHCERRGTVYGSVALMRGLGMLEAKLLSEKEVIQIALDVADFRRVERHSDGLLLDIAMMHPWPTLEIPRTCAVYFKDGVLTPLLPELPASYNLPDIRYSTIAHLNGTDFEQILRDRLAQLS